MLVGFAAIEDRAFRFPLLAEHSGGHHAVGNVRGVEPVMRNRRDRIRERRETMWKRDRAQRWFACEAAIELPCHGGGQRTLVLRRELHEEVMRMLSIVDRVSIADFATGE